MDIENRNAEDIKTLRQEVKSDISEIHLRIDQIFKVLSDLKSNGIGNGQASWVRQSIGLTIAVTALLAFLVPTMVAIVRPMQQQIDYVREYSRESIFKIDEKLQIEISKQSEAENLENDRAKARLDKLETWAIKHDDMIISKCVQP